MFQDLDSQMYKMILHAVYGSPGLSGEEFYAEQLSENTAKIMSIPFNPSVCAYGDIVEFEGEEVKSVVESTHRIFYFSFQGPEGLFGVLESYFQKYNIHGEVLVGNYFGIAVPVDMSREEFSNIIEKSPVLLNISMGNMRI